MATCNPSAPEASHPSTAALHLLKELVERDTVFRFCPGLGRHRHHRGCGAVSCRARDSGDAGSPLAPSRHVGERRPAHLAGLSLPAIVRFRPSLA